MLPPSTVHVKRKATDDPVDLLHVHSEIDGTRQEARYVFKLKRQRTSAALNDILSNSASSQAFDSAQSIASLTVPTKAPKVIATQPGDEFRHQSVDSLAKAPTIRKDSNSYDKPSLPGNVIPAQSSGGDSLRKPTPRPTAEPRRFHMSRSALQKPRGGIVSRKSEAKYSAAVFVERKKPVRNAGTRKSGAAFSQTVINPREPLFSVADEKNMPLKQSQSLPQSVDSNREEFGAPLRNVKLPSGNITPWDASNATLEDDMQSYILQEIGKNLAASEAHDASVQVPHTTPEHFSSRFKPKAPALRYRERHPEIIQGKQRDVTPDDSMMDLEDEDTDYIIDTYVRMPADDVVSQETPENIGLLVLDSQPDFEKFYNENDSDSDSEIYDEEEDENAENHPSTDYPDDEVESDDEYDRNPYSYRNRNASDNEEFDENDVTFSDDEFEEIKHPYSSRPWMPGYVEKHELDEDEA